MKTDSDNPVRQAFEQIGRDYEPEPETWSTDVLMGVYVELAKLKDLAKARLDRINAHMSQLEEGVVKYFQNEAKQRDTRRGRTVYLSRELWPRIHDDDLIKGLPADSSKAVKDRMRELARVRLVEALSKDPSTEHLVKETYNNQTLRSFILNDCEEDPETGEVIVPEHLKNKLGVSEVFRAKVVKSTGG